ncbi:MAG TPA: acyltransferase [Solirubrobacteraceae bacterium]|nr:acyltransferase [Solirubrobacteraceae bacterium]
MAGPRPVARLRSVVRGSLPVEQVANLILRLPSRRLRDRFVRSVLRWPMGEDVHIGRAVSLQGTSGITIGSRVFIHRHTELDLRGGLTIGDDVAIGPHCRILSADHDADSPTREYRERSVAIGNRAWLGTGACLLPGTAVGDGTVVGASAVAHGALDDFSIYVGNPARRLRERAPDAQLRLSGTMRRFQ